MLTTLNIIQLVLYIAVLALIGQGVLYLLAGARRDQNFFYKLLQTLSLPFTAVVRKITPRQVGDHQVPIVTFFLLVLALVIVWFEIVNLCVGSNFSLPGCRRAAA